jgi:hypothetical protein
VLAFLLAGCELSRSGNDDCCYIHRRDDLVGSIEVNKKANLIVLDRNLFDLPAQQINETKVLMTLFDGAVVFQQPSDAQ